MCGWWLFNPSLSCIIAPLPVDVLIPHSLPVFVECLVYYTIRRTVNGVCHFKERSQCDERICCQQGVELSLRIIDNNTSAKLSQKTLVALEIMFAFPP